MPVTCLVVGCGSRNNRDIVKFYSVPAVLSHRFVTHKNELSERRRALWIAAIKRDDLTESKLKYQRVCNKHFITGKPAALEDENHPDWVPSQEMGHKTEKINRQHHDVGRKGRLEKRRKLRAEQADFHVDRDSETEDHDDWDTGIASQTNITMEELTLKFEQMSFASKTIESLQKKIDNSPFGLRDVPSDDKKWKYYTGFTHSFIECIIYKIIEDNITTTSITALSPFNQLLLTLIKLRLNLHFRDLAYHFKISRTTASTYFESVIDILNKTLKLLIIWPDRAVARKNIPPCFQEAFHDKTTIIVDCFEVFIERPASLKTQIQCWSNYKHHNTVKFLIGITPQGTVSYISKAWGGHASDKQIVENSDFLNYISPGDIVLADRGFLIKETLGVMQAKLVIPAFTRGKNQLHPLDIEATRQIAHVRIHVERIIGMIKNKFNIFKDTIPLTMIKKANNPDNLNILDKIVTVCCALINVSPPIVPL